MHKHLRMEGGCRVGKVTATFRCLRKWNLVFVCKHKGSQCEIGLFYLVWGT